ncbi:uncharacterized protein LOC131235037 [Magnolia sinica]|uniref:uncharacterized protein LOC131235037 n=1 Tax=Magnolia sinica TaxID=86752 RepID=UPI00265B4BAD|nr:uncharacterized protein LOC131235037 [Magnolia sinica]
MATSLPSFNGLIRPRPTLKSRKSLKVRAQSYGDQGNSANIVDANINTLKERIEQVKMHERLQRYCKGSEGWNYQSGYDYKLKRDANVYESLNIARTVVGTLGFTFLSGTFFLYLVSLLLHLSH